MPDELSFTSRRPAVLGGLLALDPTALDTARGVAEALEAFADFDAYSAEIGMAAFHRVDAMAHGAHQTEGEYRTLPQLRADAFAQTLLEAGGTTERPTPATYDAGAPPVRVPSPEGLADLLRPEIVVHIPATVLLGGSDDTAELEGYGVVDAHTARGPAAAAPTWQRRRGSASGQTAKECPSSSAGRRIGRRIPCDASSATGTVHARVPGCMRAAHRAEIDHTVEWQDGGSTDADNLALLCPKHHALKSLALFTLQRRASGDLVWTTLLGYGHPAEPLDRDHIPGPRGVDLTARPGELAQPSGPPPPPEPEHGPPPEQRAEEPPPF